VSKWKAVRMDESTFEEMKKLKERLGARSNSEAIIAAIRFYQSHDEHTTSVEKARRTLVETEDNLATILPEYGEAIATLLAICRSLFSFPPTQANKLASTLMEAYTQEGNNGKGDAGSDTIMNATSANTRFTAEFGGKV